MARTKQFYFKAELAMLGDERIQDLLDAYGAFGFGVWFACLFQIYSHGNETRAPLDRDKMVSRAARTLGESKADVLEVCEWMAREGLFNKELWDRGFSTNEYAAGVINAHWSKVESGRKGGRPPKKPQVETIGGV